MFATQDNTTYTIATNRCDHCGRVIAIVSISRLVMRRLGIWQHSTLVLHKDEAGAFSQAVMDAITLSELESDLGS